MKTNSPTKYIESTMITEHAVLLSVGYDVAEGMFTIETDEGLIHLKKNDALLLVSIILDRADGLERAVVRLKEKIVQD